MKPHVAFALLLGLTLALTGLLQPGTAAAAPTLSLNPNSGDAPSVSGTLSGNGWLCDSVSVGPVTVSGGGVSGSASVDRVGNLSGNFTVTGSPGQTRTVRVTADMSCPATLALPPLKVLADFTFNDEPTETPEPSATPADTPSPTATPTPVAPTATLPPAAAQPTPTDTPAVPGQPPTPTPTLPAPVTGGAATAGILKLAGCDPPASQVMVDFVPVDGAGGPSMLVPTTGGGGIYAFNTPDVQDAMLFSVAPKVDDPGCALNDDPNYWLSGNSLVLDNLIGGNTELRILQQPPSQDPCDVVMDKEIQIGCWATSADAAGKMSNLSQRFRIKSQDANAKQALLQVSLQPFAPGLQDDLLAPSNLLATWDVDCADCEFTVPLKPLAPSAATANKSDLDKAVDVALIPIKMESKGGSSAVKAIKHLFGIGVGGGGSQQQTYKLTEPKLPSSSQLNQITDGSFVLPLPFIYYFRTIPLTEDGLIAGGPSNTVILRWNGEKTLIDELGGLSPCPGGTEPVPGCPTVVPQPKAFDVEIISYNPLLPPQKSAACFIVLEKGSGLYLGNHFHAPTTPSHSGLPIHPYYPGDFLCPPDPPDSCGLTSLDSFAACIEEGFGALEDLANWVSAAYNDAKAAVVKLAADVFGPFVSPFCDSSCLKTALKTGLDGALLAAGIPPSLPNLDQLMDQGIDYLAEQAVEQIPAEIQAAAQGAGIDAKAELKKAIQQGISELQKSYSDSVNWLPSGIAVRPDGWKSPQITVRITRNADVPFNCPPAGMKLDIQSNVTNDFSGPGQQAQVDNFNAKLPKQLKPGLKAGQWYYIYVEAHTPLPCLEPGETITVPVVLYPLMNFGQGHGFLTYADDAWSKLYYQGTVNFHASLYTTYLTSTFGSDHLETAADASYP